MSFKDSPASRPSSEYDLFISYARDDNAEGWITSFVDELLVEHRLFTSNDPARELRLFFDKEAIGCFDDWRHRIYDGLAKSRLFLAFLSPNYFASEWCRREWRVWIDTEIAKHILSAGAAPIYIVEVPGFVGKVAGLAEQAMLSEQEVAAKVAELCRLPGPHEPFIAAAAPVVGQLRNRRQITTDFVRPFRDEGIAALRRADLRKVLARLAADLDQRAQNEKRAADSITTVPSYNKRFTGRLDELLYLRERLKDDRAGVITGIHGLPGIGKTELAFTYAHAFAGAYPGGRFLIGCEGKSSLRDAILAQSDFTGLFGKDISDEERKLPDAYFAAVLRCLRERLAVTGHVLLVLDNVTDAAIVSRRETDILTALGPRLHLLATTRLPAPGGAANWLSLGQLPEHDALDLLEKYRSFASDSEREAAHRIVKRLGGFTLAVEIAAAHLKEHPDLTCARMADIIGLEDLEDPAVLESAADLRYDHDRRLSAVLGPTLDALSPAERRAMEYAALLPPDHVPLPWLETLVVADFPEIGRPGRLRHPWGDLWRRLEKLTLLIRPETETNEPRLMRVHRLVQDLIRRDLAVATERHVPGEPADASPLAARQQAVNALVRERVAALEKETQWEEARWELEPLEALAWHWAEPAPPDSGSPAESAGSPRPTAHEGAAWLLNQVGDRRQALAEWSLAEPLMRRALEIFIDSLGENHPLVATGLNNLAQLLQATNRLAEAEPLMHRALEIFIDSLGENNQHVATSLNNLAGLLQATNRLDEAEPLMRRALEIFIDSLGENNPHVAANLNNLALLLQDTNRLAEAETLIRRALEIFIDSLGENNPHVATGLNNLAQLLRDTNRHAEAEPLMRRALAIDEASFGPAHHKVATELNNLALLLQDTNRYDEAEPLYRRALAIDEASFGKDHFDVARDLSNLALLLRDANRHAEGEPLIRRALAIDEASFGPDHPKVATRLNNLALLLQDTNRYDEAEPLYRRALAIDEASFGKDHPKVATSLNNLAQLLKATNRLAEAEPLMRRVVEIFLNFTQATGHPHPHLRAAAGNYAGLLRTMGRSSEEIEATLAELGRRYGVDLGAMGRE